MQIALVAYNGVSAAEFEDFYRALTEASLQGQSLGWQVCSLDAQMIEADGLKIIPTHVGASLAGFDAVYLAGGEGAQTQAKNPRFIDWLGSARDCSYKAAGGAGVLLAALAGLLQGRFVAADPALQQVLEPYVGGTALQGAVLEDEGVLTAANGQTAYELGCRLCEKVMSVAPDQASSTLQTVFDAGRKRSALVTRKTNETSVTVGLNLDGSGRCKIHTGLGFLDHMLTQIAVHGMFDLTIDAAGDLQVDEHHTVEDVALTLGRAFAQALGERRGIIRMASAYVPMDDSLGFVVVDFSGRPYAVIEAAWHTPSIGGIASSLFTHFLESFAMAAGCNLHTRVLYGHDDHHQVEAVFKALARALETATRIDPRRSGVVPSSKGSLTV